MTRSKVLFSKAMKSELIASGYCTDVFEFSDGMESYIYEGTLPVGAPRPRIDELKIQFGQLSQTDSPSLLISYGSKVPEHIALEVYRHLCVTSRSPLTWRDEKYSKSLFEELILRGFDLSTFRLSINMTPHDRKRRFRRPRTKDGELKMQWGKIGQECADLLIAWGEGCQQHRRLFFHFFEDSFYNGHNGKFENSLSESFKKSGLNTKSLKVFCSLKKATHN